MSAQPRNQTKIKNTNKHDETPGVLPNVLCTYYPNGASLSDFMMKWDGPVDFKIDCLRSIGETSTQDIILRLHQTKVRALVHVHPLVIDLSL